MKKIILGLVLSLAFFNEVSAQSFDAIVNRTTLPEGETLVLTLELKDDDSSTAPDVSALSKNFTILSVSNGYRTHIINGDVSKSRQWNLVLIPNQAGDLVIPAIKLDSYQSQPINLKVIPAGQEEELPKAKVNTPQFKISGTVNNKSPYVQQQVNYRLVIHDSGGLQGESPVFLGGNDDWTIKALGQPKVETKIVNGRTLREITFDYALFPLKSGDLTVPAVRFNGYYLSKETRHDPFARFFEDEDLFTGFGLHDVFASKTPVVLTTKAIPLKVLPALNNTGWWLPAKDVSLHAEFENAKPNFKVGEAVARTIYLKAVGALDTQLPEIKFAEVDGVKQYPEKPIVATSVENGQVVSVAQITNVYIPSVSGEITLPEISVSWFNTSSQQAAVSSIPAYKTNVVAADNIAEVEVLPDQPQANAPVVITKVEKVDNGLLIWLLLGAFVGGIGLCWLLMKLLSHHKARRVGHKRQIILAAKAKDLHTLRAELLAWVQQEFPSRQITNLQDVADAFNYPPFNKELDKIRETLYAEDSADWDNKTFLDIFNHIASLNKKHTRTRHEPLPKLYK